jgi:hydrogenase maturation protease
MERAPARLTPVVVVLGLGNELRRDDAAGLLALASLAGVREWPPEVAFVAAGTGLVRCVERLRGARWCLAIDALAPSGSPGRVVLAPIEAVASSGPLSPHAPALPSLLGLLPPEDRPACWVLGIEAGDAGFGEGLSPEVRAALPAAVAEAARWIDGRLGDADDPEMGVHGPEPPPWA